MEVTKLRIISSPLKIKPLMGIPNRLRKSLVSVSKIFKSSVSCM